MLASLFFQKHLIHPETYRGGQFKQVGYIRQQSVKQMVVLGHPVGEQVVSLVVDTHEVEMFVHGKVQLPLELVHRVLDMRLAHAPYTIQEIILKIHYYAENNEKGDKKKNIKETTLSPSALSMMSAQPTS